MGRINLNECAVLAQTRDDITTDDQVQLAQLIGYSVDGFCDLDYAEHRVDDLWPKAVALIDSDS
jgi:hypothetical protein